LIIKGIIGVPAFDVKEYSTKATKYCLCIPIINEGENIKRELELAKTGNIDKIVDIIICDGGSTDGCTNETWLKSNGVNTLLTKHDSGRLSAQLRMGFYWCLQRGYEGIITVDGNNKDSLESIQLFIDKLDEGYDFIQGSRYLKEGKANNVPLIRQLAIKLIHAPLISLAAGRRFTDTTNGFRGFSKTYLQHPRVRPFREIFNTYELLAYLSIRASQVKLKTCEVPVTRSYPKKKRIPTKISMIGGNAELLKILFKSIKGDYNP
jgi:dolichol-phosphate mannosyltransferase